MLLASLPGDLAGGSYSTDRDSLHVNIQNVSKDKQDRSVVYLLCCQRAINNLQDVGLVVIGQLVDTCRSTSHQLNFVRPNRKRIREALCIPIYVKTKSAQLHLVPLNLIFPKSFLTIGGTRWCDGTRWCPRLQYARIVCGQDVCIIQKLYMQLHPVEGWRSHRITVSHRQTSLCALFLEVSPATV